LTGHASWSASTSATPTSRAQHLGVRSAGTSPTTTSSPSTETVLLATEGGSNRAAFRVLVETLFWNLAEVASIVPEDSSAERLTLWGERGPTPPRGVVVT
jgi:hypothetical protein